MRTTIGALADDGVLEFSDGYRTRKDQLADEGYRILRVADVHDGWVGSNGKDFVATDNAKKIGQKFARQGDLLLTTKGTIGRIAIVPELHDELLVYSPQLCYFRVRDLGTVDPRYLRYWFASTKAKHQIHSMSSSTDMAPYLSLRDIRSLRVDLPGVGQQRAIGEVLGAIDDKIAAINSVSIRAGDYAAGLFEGFARLANGVPEALGKYTTMVKGASYKSADLAPSDAALLTLKCFSRDGSYNPAGLKSYAGPYRDDQVVSSGDVIVAHTDLTQDAVVVGQAVAARSDSRFKKLVASLDTAIVRANPGINAEYLLWLLKDDRFRRHCRGYLNGTTVLHLHSSAVPSYQVLLPDLADQEKFGAIVRPLLTLQEVAQRENDSLKRTRDELLPLLMNGRISVKDAERSVEDVL